MHYGKIKFFDDHKNHFGFIKDVIPPISEDEIYVNESSVNCAPSLLEDNVEVVFEIRNSRAYNVDLLSNAGIAQKKKLACDLTGLPLHKIVSELIQNNCDFSNEEKNQISNNILKSTIFKNNYNSYEMIKSIGSDQHIDKLILKIKDLEDSKKLKILNDNDLIDNIDNIWHFDNQSSTKSLLFRLSKNDNVDINSFNTFINNFKQKSDEFPLDIILKFISIFYESIDITYFFDNFDHGELETILNYLEKYLNPVEQASVLIQFYNYIQNNQIDINFSKSFKILTHIYNIHENDSTKNAIYNILEDKNIDNYKDLLDAMTFIDEDVNSNIIENLTDSYLAIKEDLTNYQTFKLIKCAHVELLEVLLDDWSIENRNLNHKLLNEFISEDKYQKYEKKSNQIIKKMADFDIKYIQENIDNSTLQIGDKKSDYDEIPF